MRRDLGLGSVSFFWGPKFEAKKSERERESEWEPNAKQSNQAESHLCKHQQQLFDQNQNTNTNFLAEREKKHKHKNSKSYQAFDFDLISETDGVKSESVKRELNRWIQTHKSQWSEKWNGYLDGWI